MAKGTVTEPAYVAALTRVLGQLLAGAEIKHERIRGDRYRFEVISDRFEGMGHPERQRTVWDAVEAALERTDLLKVGMIITVAPSEVYGDE